MTERKDRRVTFRLSDSQYDAWLALGALASREVGVYLSMQKAFEWLLVNYQRRVMVGGVGGADHGTDPVQHDDRRGDA